MKAIRLLAAVLMLLTGVLHILPLFKSPADPNAIPMLIFGIAYLSTGVFLMLNKKFAPVLGIVFPLIGLGTGFFVVGLKNWDTMLTLMFVIDAIVVIACVLLLLNKNKEQDTT
jgi:uncharacterized membrane protein HdeD (DUF308 family)